MLNLRRQLDRPRERLRRLMETPADQLGWSGRFLVYQARLWDLCFRQLHRGHVAGVAGHLTFKTLLSLIPVFVIVLLVINFFAPGPELGAKVENALFDLMNISDIQLMVDDEEVDLQDRIDGLIETARQRIDAAAAVGIVFLFGIAISVLSTIEGAVNRLWQIQRRRSAWRKFLMFWLVLTLGPPAAALAVYGSLELGRMAAVLPGWAAATLSRAVELGAVWFVFFVLYKVMPRVPVRTAPALAGAVVAGTLWHAVAKEAFVLYIHHTVGYGRVYGNLAVIPLFFLWIYVTWLFVLFGCTLAYVAQNLKELARAESLGKDREGDRLLSADFVALVVAATCARRFREGAGPAPLELLADATGVGPGRLRELLGRMEAAGLLARTPVAGAAEEAPMAYLPARDPDRITVADVLKAAESAFPIPVDPKYVRLHRAVRAAYDQVRQGLSAQAGTVTVADLVDGERAT